MAKMRKNLNAILRDAGNLVFNALSRCQDTPFLSRTARFLKVSFLGLVVALIASCGKRARTGPGGEGGPVTTCYMVGPLNPTITEVSATPNPTKGAHIIRIKATAKVLEPKLEDNYISDAWLQTSRDTHQIRMRPVDGRFSDTLEIIDGQIDVKSIRVLPGFGPETILVFVHASTSKGEQSLASLRLLISEKESR